MQGRFRISYSSASLGSFGRFHSCSAGNVCCGTVRGTGGSDAVHARCGRCACAIDKTFCKSGAGISHAAAKTVKYFLAVSLLRIVVFVWIVHYIRSMLCQCSSQFARNATADQLP